LIYGRFLIYGLNTAPLTLCFSRFLNREPATTAQAIQEKGTLQMETVLFIRKVKLKIGL